MARLPEPTVVGVAKDDRHRFSKAPHEQVMLVAGIGVEGDAHAGRTVQHRSRVARDPAQPNLRQVHLIPVQFLEEARSRGFDVDPGDLMSVVERGGLVRPGDRIQVELPGGPHRPLQVV